MPTPPPLSDEQRRAAYEKALELRRARATLKEWLAESPYWGKPRLVSIFQADSDVVRGMKVYDLLLALPGVGPQTAKGWMKKAGIPEKNTVRACGPKQTERLFALLNR